MITNQLNYVEILAILVISAIISLLLLSLTFLLTFNQKIDIEKSSAYECGFNPFSESRHRFDIKFYLVSILFIIFDVEIIYLFPFAKFATQLLPFAFWVIVFFVLILLIGVIFETRKRAIYF